MTTTNGALLVDKAAGWTSHDVVAKLRGILGQRRIGHAGTLDPMATGLLVVAVGPATRLLRFATAGTKRYEGTLQLGRATDTLDAEGTVTERAAVPALRSDTVAAAAARFVGASLQVPPMVSAVRVGGQRLYEIARAGGDVPREPRPIVVTAFTTEATDSPDRWRFAVTCSAGTFVRVLASDLAGALGTVGHLTALRRVSSGSLAVDQARTIEEVARAGRAERLTLLAPRVLVATLVSVALDGPSVAAIRLGRSVVNVDGLVGDVAGVDPAGELVGVLQADGAVLKPTVVLPTV